MGLLSRLRNYFPSAVRTAEGEYRPGPYLLNGGWLSATAGQYWNWWQNGRSLQHYGTSSAMVQACISRYAQAVAMCPGDHWRTSADGGRDRQTGATSALARILRQPNGYQSISDFLLNLTHSLYDEGNGIALALRNDRFEIAELHLFDSRQSAARIAPTGEVFYDLAGNEIVENRFGGQLRGVPARDVLHVRLHTPRHPLRGVSPIIAAALDMAASDAAVRQQVAFFENRAQPSFILTTDEKLTPAQIAEARVAWDSLTKGENAGGTPILGWGFKPQQVGGSAHDAQLAETLKMSDQRIALAFLMPLHVLGIGGQPQGSTEALMNSWLASGLGFALNHIEEAIGNLFRLRGQPEEYLEFNTRALLRSNFAERIEGLARGVQGGIFAPNEARNLEDYGAVKGGDEPRVQQQVVPLTFGMQMQPPQPAPAAPEPEPVEPEEGDAGGRHSAASQPVHPDVVRFRLRRQVASIRRSA